MWLTRKQFREGVFARDNNLCVICGEPADAAHHIVERRLWGECGGYNLSNGGSLCPVCHIKAEQTVITCEELREAAGITEVLLPHHFYKENKVDKWGNIILPDGRRLMGELFHDLSVQKILKSGGFLEKFCKYVKYPRTLHLPWSGLVDDDDRMLSDTKHFEGKKVVVTAKMDGENTTLYNDYMHARSIDGQNHASRNWLKAFHGRMSYNIPEGWRVCGENLFAKHTVEYNNLENYFLVFSIWNERNECLSWEDTLLWAELLDLVMVPVLYVGEWDEEKIRHLYQPMINGDKCEGYVVRLLESFNYGEFRTSVAKYVCEEFRQKLQAGASHWRHKMITPNKVKNVDV
jgi:hypothetical protein